MSSKGLLGYQLHNSAICQGTTSAHPFPQLLELMQDHLQLLIWMTLHPKQLISRFCFDLVLLNLISFLNYSIIKKTSVKTTHDTIEVCTTLSGAFF